MYMNNAYILSEDTLTIDPDLITHTPLICILHIVIILRINAYCKSGNSSPKED